MPIDFLGMILTRDWSESRALPGPVVDADYTRRFAQAHEAAGFDRILTATASGAPEATHVAAYAAAHTERLGFLISHRPGVMQPTVAARTYATLDQFSGGRVALHTITGAHDAEQRRDGDYLGKEERYARTDEYLTVLARAWTATEPFSFEGRYYRLEDFLPSVRPVDAAGIPIYFGGSSKAAHRVGARHADVYMLWGEPLADLEQQIAAIGAAAEAAGRTQPPRISVSFRPILAATDGLAWDRAREIKRRTEENLRSVPAGFARFAGLESRSVGQQRLLEAAGRSEVHDDGVLWTEIARLTGAPGNSTALVGSPETVARALLRYVDLGVTTILIRGFDPLDDAIDYGREFIPRVRAEVARRDAAAARVPVPAA